MKSLLSVFVLLLLVTYVSGQKAWIKGKVTDALTGEAMPGVNVVAGKTEGTVTDTEGLYQLNLNPGKHKITFSLVGYNRQVKIVDVEATKQSP